MITGKALIAESQWFEVLSLNKDRIRRCSACAEGNCQRERKWRYLPHVKDEKRAFDLFTIQPAFTVEQMAPGRVTECQRVSYTRVYGLCERELMEQKYVNSQ